MHRERQCIWMKICWRVATGANCWLTHPPDAKPDHTWLAAVSNISINLLVVSIFSVNLICFCCRYDRYDYHNASLLPALVNIEPTYLALFNVKTGADRLVGNTYRQCLGGWCGQIQRSTMFPSQKKIIIWLRSGGCSGGCRELQRVPAGRPRPWTRFAAFLLVCTEAEKSSFRWHIHIYVDLLPSIIIVIMIIASNNGLWWYRRTTGSVAPRRSRVALNVWDV